MGDLVDGGDKMGFEVGWGAGEDVFVVEGDSGDNWSVGWIDKETSGGGCDEVEGVIFGGEQDDEVGVGSGGE